nr:elongation factor 2 [Tanacetum cinerariifolium]
MDNKHNIRNVSVIAHYGHGKSILTDSLVAAAGNIPQETAPNVRMTDTRADEGKRGFSIKSTGISLCYKFTHEYLKNFEGERDGNEYIINLIDSPGHVDFSAEVTADLRITDGALVVVDCIEGVCLQTKTVLRLPLGERIRPVLILNKIDRCFLELKVDDGEEAYEIFKKVIQDANDIMTIYDDPRLGDVKFYPEKGNVAFSVGLYGWEFTLTHFAKINADKCNFDESEMMKMLWGDNFYDTETREWTQKNTGAATCERGAQRYHVENLYGGPLDAYANAIKEYDPNGPLILYVSKMFPDASDKGRFFAFGCVFAGKISTGIKVRIMHVAVEDVPCGNTVAMADLDLIITKSATLTNETEIDAHPIRAMKFSVSPIVHIALDICMKDLEEDFMNGAPINKSHLGVSCCETILEKSCETVNNGSRDEEFAWDDNGLGKKILYCTGPNMVVNIGKGDGYPDLIKESIVVGFQFASKKGGVLARENMRGICFELTTKPRLPEPVYLVEIQSRESYLAEIRRELNNRRGNVFEEMPREGPPMYKIKAWLPVVESFRFSGYLQGSTNDDVFPQCVFHQWVMMSFDPLTAGSEARKLVAVICEMKGFEEQLPQISDFV